MSSALITNSASGLAENAQPITRRVCRSSQHRGQVMPAALRPDVGDIATPHLIGTLDSELTIQPIRDIWPLNRSLFVGMRARLLADQAQLTHQPTHPVTADGHALFAQHAQDAAAAGRAPTLAEQLVDLAA